MVHALMIDDNMSRGRALENRLWSIRADPFHRPWTEARAIKTAQCQCPDRVVIGHLIACGSLGEATQHIAAPPICMVVSGCCEVRGRLPEDAMVDGPMFLNDIAAAALVRRCQSVLAA